MHCSAMVESVFISPRGLVTGLKQTVVGTNLNLLKGKKTIKYTLLLESFVLLPLFKRLSKLIFNISISKGKTDQLN